jgi:hypothetical protein
MYLPIAEGPVLGQVVLELKSYALRNLAGTFYICSYVTMNKYFSPPRNLYLLILVPNQQAKDIRLFVFS